MKIEIFRLGQNDVNDFMNLIKVFENVFEWENFSTPSVTHFQNLLYNDKLLVFIAKTDNKVVGGLTAHVLDRYDSEKPSAYIYDIAVISSLQRKGIGKLLLASLNKYCRKFGFHEIFVQAETDDIQAVNFYKSTPISSELNATHFTYSLN